MEFHRATTDKTPRLERVAMPWGYMDSKGQPHYYIPDYQGNIRMVVDADGNVEQATDYYPYGMPMATSTGADVNRYKYSGKELETRNGLNFYDFAARLQFPAINFMNQPDVNAADYPWLNPYLYCAANPINITDPTGQKLQVTDKDGSIYDYQIEYNVDTRQNEIAIYNSAGNRISQDDIQDGILIYMLGNLEELINTNVGEFIVSGVIDSDKIVNLSFDKKKGENTFNFETGTITYNPRTESAGLYYNGSEYVTGGSPTISLCHEMAHAYDWVNGTFDTGIWAVLNDGYKVLKADIFACRVENKFRKEINFSRRISYVNVVNEQTKTIMPDSKTMIPTFPLFLIKLQINSSTIII